jgi:hypothetical protein
VNRRGFLQAILAAGVAPAVVGSGVLMPIRKLVMPELVVWGENIIEATENVVPMAVRGGQLLTVSQITQEALRILEENLVFSSAMNSRYLAAFNESFDRRLVVHTRRPGRFAA